MSIICPNFNNKEVKQQFDEIAAATSEQAAYHIWSQNNGNAIDRAPNGAPSKLFSDLLEHFNGDRKATIQAKAKVFSESFKTWFGDWNTKSKTVSTDAAKRLVAYLEEIPKESRYKTLAQLLIDSESLPFSLRYFDINNNRDDIVGTSGQWNSFANLIEVLGSNVNDDSITKTLLHELIHYNTEYLLETYRKNPDNLTETQRKNIESIHKAINYAKKYILDNYDESKFRSIKEKQGVTSRIFYAFDNHQEIEIDEVISEAFTNPAFQEVLNEIPYEGTKQSIFDRIIEAIVNIFGLKVKDNSVLKEIITHSSELTEIESRIKSTNVSKVVDENGEPIILYHTVLPSYNASFGVFNTINEEGNQTMIYFTDNLDMSKSYARNHRLFKTLDNVKKRLSEIPAEIIKRNEYVTSNLNKLTSDETYIKELGYTGFEDQSLLDLIDYYKKSQVDYTESRAKEKAELEAIIENPKSIEYTKLGFLNLKNPLVINGRGNWWNELSLNPDDDIVKMAKHNDLVNKTIEDRTRGEAERKLKDNPALEVLPYDELLGDDEIEKIRNEVTEEVLKELGDLYKFESTRTIEEYARNIEQYDGVIFENIRDYGAGGIKFGNDFMANTVYAAKNPNQIKSAVGNTGEFSKETPNIYAAQSSSTAIPLTDSSKWLYRKYNLLNSKGEIKTIPYTSKKQIATADKWVATLNKNKLNYKFAIKLTPVGHKILIYDTTPNLFGSNSTESEILNKINALSPEELRGQAVESPKVNTNIVNSNDVFAELTNSEDTTLATLATAVKSMVDSLSDEGIEIVYTSETLDTLFPGTLIHSKTPAVYDPVSNKIYVSTSVSLQGHAYSGNPKHAMQRILLHEIVHAYTVKALHGDSAAAKKLNELFEAYKAKHTDYAATNIAEFVAELFSNPSVMTNMMDIESGNMSLLQRLYEWFKSLFTSKSELSSEAVQAVLDLITEHNADMTLTLDDEQAPIPFAANSVREELAIERLNSTFNDVKESILSKLATLRYNKFNKQAAAKSEKEQSSLLYRLKTISENLTGEAMMDMADQLDGIVEYIDNVASSMTDMRTLLVGDGTTKGIEQRMQEAISSNDAATLQEIEAILDDFYRNSLKPIKDNLDKIYDTLTEPNNRNVYMPVVGIDQYQIILDMTHGLIEQLSPERMANQDNIGYTYKNIAIQKTQNYLLNRGIEAKDPGIMNALKNWLKIDRDINFFERWAGSSTSSRNFILRLVAKQINDIDNYVVRTHHNAFAKLRKVAVGTNKRMHLFELDENGKKTGFLIRDRKYGVYNTDRSAFRDSWLMSHDILSFNDLKLNKQLYKQYLKDMNVWIDERANRRYTKEYYDIFADLSVEATEALDEANDMIENIVYQYRGKTTRKIRFEDMPEDVYEEYKYAIQRKRNLANPYNYDTGEAKTGLEKDIADEIRAMNEKLSKGLKSKANMDAFYAEMQAVKDSSEPIPFGKSKYDLWLERNTRFDYTEDFKKFLEMRAKKEYGDAYNNLRESLNNILNLYRNHNNEIDYTIMPESAKEMVRRLDIAMAKIAATKRGGVRSQKAFNVRLSEVVNENGGKDALVSGVDTYVDGTKVRYHSYLTKLEPIDSANNVVRVPNNNWNETTEESSYWNPDYDSAVKDKEQPKKSIARYNNDKGFELLNPNSPRFDKNLRDLYDAIIDMIHEANDKLHFQENANDYKLPQKTGGFQNYIAGAGLIHGFGKYIKDHTRILSQDEGFGGDHMTTADGRRILLPPTHYMAMLDDTTIGTNDLVGVVGAYYKMALNYEAKEKISHQLNLINDIVKDYAEYNSEGTRRRSPDANLSKKIDQLIKMFVYGEKNAKYELNLLGTKIAIGKLLNSFTSWGRNSGLAHNPRSAMTGGISAATFYYNESKVGNIYNGSNLTNGTAVALKEYLTLKMLMDTGKNVSTNSLIFGMMEYNGISFDQDEETKHVGRMRIGRIAGNIGAKYNFFKLASILPNSFILPAIYDNYRLVTKQDGTKEFMSENHFVKFEEIPGISNDNPASIKQKQAIFRTFKENLWSAYSQDKDGTIRVKDEYKQYVTAELENEVTSKAKWVASHAEGMATGVDKTGLFYHPAAAVMFLFRYFIMKNIENAFAKMHWNYEIKTVMMGTLTALFQGYMYGTNHKWYTKLYNRIDAIRDSSGFVSFIKAIAIGKSSPEMNAKRLAALEELKKEFGDIDIKTEIARYQTRFNSQISGFFFWSIVVSNLISIIFGGDTDDDDDYFVNMGLYMLRRVELETGSRYNPSDIASIVNSISPLTKHFSNVIHAINMFEESDDKKIKKGAYKGLYGWQRDVIRVVPILNAYYNMKNPKEKLNNLKNTLNR
jgi:hypothetical protein